MKGACFIIFYNAGHHPASCNIIVRYRHHGRRKSNILSLFMQRKINSFKLKQIPPEFISRHHKNCTGEPQKAFRHSPGTQQRVDQATTGLQNGPFRHVIKFISARKMNHIMLQNGLFRHATKAVSQAGRSIRKTSQAENRLTINPL